MHFATYIPHPKPPFSQQVPLACWWLSGVFPHILLILEHKIGCFVVVSMVFSCKSRCGCILYIYLFFLSLDTITLKRLSQSEPNLHTWLLMNSSDKFKNGHRRSHVTPPPLIGGFCPPPWKLTYLRFQQIQTKFSQMTFDWNSASEFENGHHRSKVIPPPPPQ